MMLVLPEFLQWFIEAISRQIVSFKIVPAVKKTRDTGIFSGLFVFSLISNLAKKYGYDIDMSSKITDSNFRNDKIIWIKKNLIDRYFHANKNILYTKIIDNETENYNQICVENSVKPYLLYKNTSSGYSNDKHKIEYYKQLHVLKYIDDILSKSAISKVTKTDIIDNLSIIEKNIIHDGIYGKSFWGGSYSKYSLNKQKYLLNKQKYLLLLDL
jgi:hypothetical protein